MYSTYQSLAGLFTPRLMLLSCSFLKEEDNFKVEKAVNKTVAGLIYSVLSKNDSSELEFVIRKSGRAYPEIESKLENIFYGNADEKIYYLGSQFLDALYVSEVNTFISLISKSSGLSIRSTDKLVSMITPVISGYLGNKIISEKISFHELIRRIEYEKESFENQIPAGLSEPVIPIEKKHNLNRIIPETENHQSLKEEKVSNKKLYIYILTAIFLILFCLFFILKFYK